MASSCTGVTRTRNVCLLIGTLCGTGKLGVRQQFLAHHEHIFNVRRPSTGVGYCAAKHRSRAFSSTALQIYVCPESKFMNVRHALGLARRPVRQIPERRG